MYHRVSTDMHSTSAYICNGVSAWLHSCLHASCTWMCFGTTLCLLSSAWDQQELVVLGMFTEINGVNICRFPSCCKCLALCSCPHLNLKKQTRLAGRLTSLLRITSLWHYTFIDRGSVRYTYQTTFQSFTIFHLMQIMSVWEGHNQHAICIRQSTDLLMQNAF